MYHETLEDLMKSEKLSPETKLYRYTNTHHIESNDSGGTFIKANQNSQEMVVDHYENGHLTKAEEIGAGLAFCIQKENEYEDKSKTCVAIMLSSIIDQGGKIYKDKSSYVYDSWFLTMPSGKAEVEVLK